MIEQIRAIKNHDSDNVATLFGKATKGTVVTVMDKSGKSFPITVREDIPYGHKIALVEIRPDEQITKYGEEIGIATSIINVGEHVHIHNIDSIRGRGDWEIKRTEK